MSNNMLTLPQCAESKRRIWLTRFVASGSTGNVTNLTRTVNKSWLSKRHSQTVGMSFLITVTTCSPLSICSRQRIRNEFNVYLTLDRAYYSGQLRDRIAPRCYGAFKGNPVDVLILDLCEGILNQWGELSDHAVSISSCFD